MSLFDELRNKYPNFYYHGYSFSESENSIKIQYQFEIEGLSLFTPTWEFTKTRGISVSRIPYFETMVFSLGMTELVSYWKLTCSPHVFVPFVLLDAAQTDFWKKMYFGGLGEFFYVNGIHTDPDSFMSLYSEGETLPKGDGGGKDLSGCLIPVGGGKDSAVTLEVLREIKNECCTYCINGRGATSETCRVAGYDRSAQMIARRVLDRRMLDLNRQGFLNGHTPFSAVVAFSSLIQAILTRKKYVVLSNESSANESTVSGSDVNHQFSKSIWFEKSFREYEKEYIGCGVEYFSLLRPLSEYQIALLFSTYPRYHSVFRSCNVGSKTDEWCGRCPKCLFVYGMLSAFLSEEKLTAIFGKDLFSDESLKDTLNALIGVVPDKPFECVGSRDELTAALKRCIAKRKGKTLPFLLAYFESLPSVSSKEEEDYLNYFDTEHFLPASFETMLKEALKKGYHDVCTD